jgi:hypothetical protein
MVMGESNMTHTKKEIQHAALILANEVMLTCQESYYIHGLDAQLVATALNTITDKEFIVKRDIEHRCYWVIEQIKR